MIALCFNQPARSDSSLLSVKTPKDLSGYCAMRHHNSDHSPGDLNFDLSFDLSFDVSKLIKSSSERCDLKAVNVMVFLLGIS